MSDLTATAKMLVAPAKGIFAADESVKTETKRFAEIGLVATPELSQKYREMFFNTSGIEEFLSGVIFYKDTLKQGNLLEIIKQKGIIPGIKVDEGLEEVGEETLTKGLDTLDQRLKEYKELGLQFAKWRAAFKITDIYPSKENLEENLNRMAEYALISQSNEFVPILEPEVLMDGQHTTTRCEEITRDMIKLLFEKLKAKNVDHLKMILKVNMVMPGKDNGVKAEPFEVANATLRTIKVSVPEDVAGVVFLSGGQAPDQVTANLNEIEKLSKTPVYASPWPISFSFERALESEAMHIWAGKDENVVEAQKAFYKRAKLVSAARQGQYTPEMEG